jgi:hypothetical protein
MTKKRKKTIVTFEFSTLLSAEDKKLLFSIFQNKHFQKMEIQWE